MEVNIYKLSGDPELVGTHQISSKESLQRVINLYDKDYKISDADNTLFLEKINTGNDWLFGNFIYGPLFKIKHVEAD